MNKVNITIENCKDCPCVFMKHDKNNSVDIMYCHTKHGIITLRKGMGPRNIPGWCPLLNKEEEK